MACRGCERHTPEQELLQMDEATPTQYQPPEIRGLTLAGQRWLLCRDCNQRQGSFCRVDKSNAKLAVYDLARSCPLSEPRW